jgi:hypothetical protein
LASSNPLAVGEDFGERPLRTRRKEIVVSAGVSSLSSSSSKREDVEFVLVPKLVGDLDEDCLCFRGEEINDFAVSTVSLFLLSSRHDADLGRGPGDLACREDDGCVDLQGV